MVDISKELKWWWKKTPREERLKELEADAEFARAEAELEEARAKIRQAKNKAQPKPKKKIKGEEPKYNNNINDILGFNNQPPLFK